MSRSYWRKINAVLSNGLRIKNFQVSLVSASSLLSLSLFLLRARCMSIEKWQQQEGRERIRITLMTLFRLESLPFSLSPSLYLSLSSLLSLAKQGFFYSVVIIIAVVVVCLSLLQVNDSIGTWTLSSIEIFFKKGQHQYLYTSISGCKSRVPSIDKHRLLFDCIHLLSHADAVLFLLFDRLRSRRSSVLERRR